MIVTQQVNDLQVEHEIPTLVHYNSLMINFISGEIRINGLIVRLTPVERKLFLAIARYPEKLHRYDDLQRSLWGNVDPNRHIQLQNYICRLRRKLRVRNWCPIVTEQGRGYRFSLPPLDE